MNGLLGELLFWGSGVLLMVTSALYAWVCIASAPPESRPVSAAERFLVDEFVRGEMEVEEFEQRLDAILHNNPLPPDRPRNSLSAVLKAAWTDEPGTVHYYDPVMGRPEWEREWRANDTLAHQRIAGKIEQLRHF